MREAQRGAARQCNDLRSEEWNAIATFRAVTTIEIYEDTDRISKYYS